MLSFLSLIIAVGGVATVVCLIVFLGMMLFVKRPNPKIILGMIALFGVTLVSTFTFPSVARSELRDRLAQEILTVYSAGEIDTEQALHELKNIAYVTGKNSSPGVRFSFEIKTAAEVIRLQLAQDSNDSQVYWVFYPEYRAGAMNDIGKIVLSTAD
ncbi:hypothetical protein [Motilimonas cestriensis]|uniref:hypothetical protein n=1 Tax=Motilimonas cestriensis TaxID=2742685 RepID=UPI003DA31CC2